MRPVPKFLGTLQGRSPVLSEPAGVCHKLKLLNHHRKLKFSSLHSRLLLGKVWSKPGGRSVGNRKERRHNLPTGYLHNVGEIGQRASGLCNANSVTLLLELFGDLIGSLLQDRVHFECHPKTITNIHEGRFTALLPQESMNEKEKMN